MLRVLQRLRSRATGTLRCSFCGKDQHAVAQLVAGPSVLICDGCVDLCAEIVRAEREKVSAR